MRWIAGAPVDGYEPKTRVIFQFHGCHRHGCVKCFRIPNNREKLVAKNGLKDRSRDEAFHATAERTRALRAAGYHVIEKRKVISMLFSTISNLPRQNATERGHARSDLRKRACSDFGEPW